MSESSLYGTCCLAAAWLLAGCASSTAMRDNSASLTSGKLVGALVLAVAAGPQCLEPEVPTAYKLAIENLATDPVTLGLDETPGFSVVSVEDGGLGGNGRASTKVVYAPCGVQRLTLEPGARVIRDIVLSARTPGAGVLRFIDLVRLIDGPGHCSEPVVLEVAMDLRIGGCGQ